LALCSLTGPDGALWLASASEDWTIRLWDLATRQPVGRPLVGHSDWIYALIPCPAPDGGTLLVSGGGDERICRWNAVTGSLFEEPLAAHDGVLAAAIVPGNDGLPLLAVAGRDGVIHLWDPVDGGAVGKPLVGHTASVWALAMCQGRDGRPILVSAGADETIRRWDPRTGRPAGPPLPGHVGRVAALVACRRSSAAGVFASAGEDATIRLWDVSTGRQIDQWASNHSGGVSSLVACPGKDGTQLLASGGADGNVSIWNLDSGQRVNGLLTGHAGWVTRLISVRTSDGGVIIASAGGDGTIRLWDPVQVRPLDRLATGHAGSITSLVTCPGPADSTLLASASADGSIRLWDPATGAASGTLTTGHSGWVRGLATCRRNNDENVLASAGVDGSVRLWDTIAQVQVGETMSGHGGWLRALAAVPTPEGRDMLASAGEGSTVRLWNPATNRVIGTVSTGHTALVRALATYPCPDGSTLLACAGRDGTIRLWDVMSRDAETVLDAGVGAGADAGIYALTICPGPDGVLLLAAGHADGTVRLWNPIRGLQVGGPLHAHDGVVTSLANCPGPDGPVLASGGVDGAIRLWNTRLAQPAGQPLTGHRDDVLALTTCPGPNNATLLASAGADGTIRLWDTQAGVAVRTIEVGAVTLRTLSDAAATRDLLGREALVGAITDQLQPPANGDVNRGPTVVTIEGPWGSGKTTIMRLVRQQLEPAPRRTPRTSAEPTPKRLTVREADLALSRPTPPSKQPSDKNLSRRRAVTGWFNPWEHQSGQQVWAGLAEAVIEAAAPVLYPDHARRERYWFHRNLARLDRHVLRRRLRLRLLPASLGVAAIAVVAPVLLALADLKHPLLGYQPPAIALALLTIIFVIGLAQLAWRYLHDPAAAYLPAGMFHGPVLGGSTADPSRTEPAASDVWRDPLEQAGSGSLYLRQHDVVAVLENLHQAGHSLILFIDDLDRCGAHTTAEVFEAVNLFLANPDLRGSFVIGLDPVVVAAHLDRVYTDISDPRLALHGDDPSPGWAFLRKLVQLPVAVPHISDQGIDHFLSETLTPATAGEPAPTQLSVAPAVRQDEKTRSSGAPSPAKTRMPATTITDLSPLLAVDIRGPALETHPRIQQLIRQRLCAQPERSIREAKRLLSVWQLYVRILDQTHHEPDPAASLTRACHLVILAEITTRWPALHRDLHRHTDGKTGLQLLAGTANDDQSWAQACHQLGLAGPEHARAINNLRDLLRQYDATAVAELAAPLTQTSLQPSRD
jgi:WD40 repeat protein